MPFHLSMRYADDPRDIFDELEAACSRVVLPDPDTSAALGADPGSGAVRQIGEGAGNR